jgi:hypothetical protein
MKAIIRFLFVLLTQFIFVGCQSGGGMGHALGAIEASDIRQANYMRDQLPNYLGLPDSRIQVESGSGVVHVTISGVSDTPGRQTLISKLHDFEVSNPKSDPIKLLIYPGDQYVWSKATLIQK